MDSILQAILLGVIEGVTEFLPVSSTGHLLIAQHWLDRRSDLFNIAIQCGAIVAVLLVYRERLSGLLRNWREPESRDYLLKITVAFVITVVLGLVAKQLGAELPDTVTPVAWALIIGGIVIFAIEYWVKSHAPSETVGWSVVIAVGIAQIVAGIFPGVSRSAAAIFAALLFGLTSRPRAAEFAFLVGIPTMFAASAYELLKMLDDRAAFAAEPWGELGIACLVSALTAFITVKWLLRYISGHSFVPFAWYRLALGGLLLATVP
ncbi:MAG TPA: undecaprenyl-diphosphate phosphatase [Solimonas sp.]|nr:undecaprenyl-diphosphate phosphatase [Solimonas sp.]